MNRIFKVAPTPVLVIGLIAGIVTSFIGPSYVYWATSGYSQKSFLLVFKDEPKEEELLDAIIYKEPLIQDKYKTTQQWRKAKLDGSRLYIKVDNNNSVVVAPYLTDQESDIVFSSGERMNGIWLTQPQTRIYFPVIAVNMMYFVFAFLFTMIAAQMLLWVWCFFLARLRELSRAIRGE